ncbi:hypothetical protein CRG98_008623, partial [Punica granatum]
MPSNGSLLGSYGGALTSGASNSPPPEPHVHSFAGVLPGAHLASSSPRSLTPGVLHLASSCTRSLLASSSSPGCSGAVSGASDAFQRPQLHRPSSASPASPASGQGAATRDAGGADNWDSDWRAVRAGRGWLLQEEEEEEAA